jgi:hypothetical protein
MKQKNILPVQVNNHTILLLKIVYFLFLKDNRSFKFGRKKNLFRLFFYPE